MIRDQRYIMNTKRLICLLLIVALTFSLSACGTGSSVGSETPGNETQSTGGTNSNTPEEPALVMPDAPTDVLEQMAYNPAYETLEDVSENVTSLICGLPSSTPVTVDSVTEFATNDELQGFISTFDNVGSYETNEFNLAGDSLSVRTDWCNETYSGTNFFFLASKDYSVQMIPVINGVMYREDADTLYVMLGYSNRAYVDLDDEQKWADETYDENIALNSVAGYYIVGLDISKVSDVKHVVFVAPEEKAYTRADINVSIVGFDMKYTELPFFDYKNNGVDGSVWGFPSTKSAEANGVDLITDYEKFASVLSNYDDITSKDRDYLVFEPGYVNYKHRQNGLTQVAEQGELLNVLITSPELDAYSSLRMGSFWIVTGKNADGTDKKELCSQFYDAETDTVYIYLEYNGQPHAQYEHWSDKEAINTNSKATYALMSVSFYNDAQHPVSNVVVVLPDPATVPAE